MPDRTDNPMTSEELAAAIRAVDPQAVLAPRHVIRRVIRSHRGITGLWRSTPHRKTYVIQGEEIGRYADPEEFDLPSDHAWPARVLLIERPQPRRMRLATPQDLLRDAWRLLYHARLDAHTAELVATGRLTLEAAQRRWDQLSPAVRDEVRGVLESERFLLLPVDTLAVYREFLAVVLELKRFVPRALPVYFPSVEDWDMVERLLGADVDAEGLFWSSRPAGASLPALPLEEPVANEGARPAPAVVAGVSSAHAQRWSQRAERASKLGNHARAAMFRIRAAAGGGGPGDGEREELRLLAARLSSALGIAGGEGLVDALAATLEPQAEDWSRPGARVLYDLQALCVDVEREAWRFDFWRWMFSLGRSPLRRPLPRLRRVAMLRHLRGALDRLGREGVPEAARTALTAILEPCLEPLEQAVRDELRPAIRKAMDEGGLAPRDVEETIARDKLVEELLDRAVEHRFVSMADVRDAVSRNDLKMPDVPGVWSFLSGDPLLRVDQSLARELDGVYRRGEVYRRLPQRLSSLAFGTPVGRFLTRNVAIPYLGAYVLLEGLQHVVHIFVKPPPAPAATAAPLANAAEAAAPAAAEAPELLATAQAATTAPDVAIPEAGGIHLTTPLTVFVVGTLILWLMQHGAIRRLLFSLLRWLLRKFQGIVIDLPSEMMRQPIVQHIVNNRAARVLTRFLIKPAFFGGVVWYTGHSAGLDPGVSLRTALVIFFALNLLYNTRLGRAVDEHTSERLMRLWRWLGVDLAWGLLRLIADAFRAALHAFETLLYHMDEWLRFRPGDGRGSLAVKLVLGGLWFAVAYFAGFVVTLLIEPQINPIKHFPVVTVSHKVLLSLMPVFIDLLAPLFNGDRAQATVVIGSVIFLIPGIFGYLAWELKENWRLYRANRPPEPGPVIVGSHGETMLSLLRPGFHSGTVSKAYARLRRAERKRAWRDPARTERRQHHTLHHAQTAVQRFIERELLHRIELVHGPNSPRLAVRRVGLGPFAITADLAPADADTPQGHPTHHATDATPLNTPATLRLRWALDGDALRLEVDQPGWLSLVPAEQARAFAQGLLTFLPKSHAVASPRAAEQLVPPPPASSDAA